MIRSRRKILTLLKEASRELDFALFFYKRKDCGVVMDRSQAACLKIQSATELIRDEELKKCLKKYKNNPDPECIQKLTKIFSGKN